MSGSSPTRKNRIEMIMYVLIAKMSHASGDLKLIQS
jgi:hypothetical protein